MPAPAYCAIAATAQPDWQRIHAERLPYALWGYAAPPETAFQCAYTPDEALYVRMVCREGSPMALNTQPDSAVWEDSCLECFFMPEGGAEYVNMEANANGALRCSIGKGRHCRRMVRGLGLPLVGCEAEVRADDWEVRFTVPQGLLSAVYPGFELRKGAGLRANFYKCGDRTAAPHYGCWSHIPLPSPDYHCPEYFGAITLG